MELGIYSRKEGNGVYLFKKASAATGEHGGLGFYATSGNLDQRDLSANEKIVPYRLTKSGDDEPKLRLSTPESMVS
ncbi:MAG: hypothetical protein AAF514_05480 [Verrucomicrobiota bacterium]